MRRAIAVVVALLAGCKGSSERPGGTTPDAPPAPFCTPKSGTNLKLTRVAENLELPVFVTAPRGDPRLFVVEQPGRIRVVKDGQVLATPFLDFDAVTLPSADRLNSVGDERGLLGLAFHPDYATNGRFFVHYTAAGHIIVAELGADPASDTARTAVTVLLRQEHIRDNHNGGHVEFGPDGFLYASIGDGGGANNSEGGGQDPDTLLGKILRIDVDSSAPYGIPTSNPWAASGGVREMFAWGLRNPYRFSIDALTRTMFIGDVGQGQWEEISVVDDLTPGLNFGWPVFEGTSCFTADEDGDQGCDRPGDYVAPAYAYDQREEVNPANPCAVIGGVVYRGTCMPDMVGQYFFGDRCVGNVGTFAYQKGATPSPVDHSRDYDTAGLIEQNLSSFGVDGFGELYVTGLGDRDPLSSGVVYRVEVD